MKVLPSLNFYVFFIGFFSFSVATASTCGLTRMVDEHVVDCLSAHETTKGGDEIDELTKEFGLLAAGFWESGKDNVCYWQSLKFSIHSQSTSFAFNEMGLVNNCGWSFERTIRGEGTVKVLRSLPQFKKGFAIELFFSGTTIMPDPTPTSAPWSICKKQHNYVGTTCDCAATSRIIWVVFEEDVMYLSTKAKFGGCPHSGMMPEPTDMTINSFPFKKL